MKNDFPVIPGYNLKRKLGKGGMATVYLAEETKLEREVALKVLLKSLTGEESLTERFIKEAKTAAQLRHANIISIFDVGVVGDIYYFSMEYMEESLKGKLHEFGKIQPEETIRILVKISSALNYAHKEGFLHRDIKPDNILFQKDGNPVLVDFGIAKAIGSSTKLTKTGMSIGTPHYMSPEQARGKPLDSRSDIYALGILLYEMLTGKVPYDAEDSIAIGIKHIQEEIPSLPDSDTLFQPLLNSLLSKNPEQRPRDGQRVVQMLSEVAIRLKGEAEKPGLELEREAEKFLDDKGKSAGKFDYSGSSRETAGIGSGDRIQSKYVAIPPSEGFSRVRKRRKITVLLLSLALLLIVLTVILLLDSDRAGVRESWEATSRTNTVAAYQNFRRNYPGSPYDDEARRRISLLENENPGKNGNTGLLIKKNQETIDFESARRKGTIKAYQEYLAKYPAGQFRDQAKDALARLTEAEEEKKRQEIYQREISLENIGAVDESKSVSYNKNGIRFVRKKELTKAILEFKRAVKANPDNPEFWNNLGYAYQLLEKWDVSNYFLGKTLRLDANRAVAYGNLGYNYAKLKQQQRAVDLYLKYYSLLKTAKQRRNGKKYLTGEARNSKDSDIRKVLSIVCRKLGFEY